MQKGSQIVGISHPNLVPGQIDSETLALPLANCICIRLWEKRPEASMLIAVPREIKDTGVIVEDILDALAMVDIPVDNENPLQPIFLLGMFGC